MAAPKDEVLVVASLSFGGSAHRQDRSCTRGMQHRRRMLDASLSGHRRRSAAAGDGTLVRGGQHTHTQNYLYIYAYTLIYTHERMKVKWPYQARDRCVQREGKWVCGGPGGAVTVRRRIKGAGMAPGVNRWPMSVHGGQTLCHLPRPSLRMEIGLPPLPSPYLIVPRPST